MTFEIQFLAWDRHKNLAELNWSMGYLTIICYLSFLKVVLNTIILILTLNFLVLQNLLFSIAVIDEEGTMSKTFEIVIETKALHLILLKFNRTDFFRKLSE